ncbi:DUF1127 domain-containing protein [Phaeovulum vinaykumarii]|uniref:Uncharacterized conserved protein YjiS, DUF1127 family n=1 Tax=Phaeovulum vinaykumarii TaxID=407234 RepID=A0A1N7MUU6_9RHOB|nr:DUF1127 domain-containing protein [Phaeovulum vinaykumarii]SIS89629.1 Uncharacterized conserved protein YjiS, DUF1127 family [Phaeovulum vinaykumarii]SOC18325.1 uncharacterized protein YjiS [Phaeovulum vinaykumarii]
MFSPSLARNPARTAPASAPVKLAAALVRMAETWHTRLRSRQALAHLDAHLLKDIGLDREHAQIEARRPFWLA